MREKKYTAWENKKTKEIRIQKLKPKPYKEWERIHGTLLVGNYEEMKT